MTTAMPILEGPRRGANFYGRRITRNGTARPQLADEERPGDTGHIRHTVVGIVHACARALLNVRRPDPRIFRRFPVG